MAGLRNDGDPILARRISALIAAGLLFVAAAWLSWPARIHACFIVLCVLGVIWSLAAIAFRCRSCGKSIYLRDLNPWGDRWSGSIWMTRLFPEKACSRCGERLSV
jgi:hypothetical protein